jgi:DNA invertase Pin-like site-specific DNA recombinase
MKIKVAIYGRVSTQDQNFDRQIVELTSYANRHDYEIIGVFAEKESGAKDYKDRPEMKRLIDLVTSGEVQKILTSEVSRLSRTVKDFLDILDICNKNCVSLYIDQFGFETFDKNCEPSPMGQMFAMVLSMFFDLERKSIKRRLHSGYDQHRLNGGSVGRKKGYIKDIKKTKHYNEIRGLLKSSVSIRYIMNSLNTSQSVVVKIKDHLEKIGEIDKNRKVVKIKK